jgi:hypothetical protein
MAATLSVEGTVSAPFLAVCRFAIDISLIHIKAVLTLDYLETDISSL